MGIVPVKVKAVIDNGEYFLMIRTIRGGRRWSFVGGTLIPSYSEEETLKLKMEEDINTVLPIRGTIRTMCFSELGHCHISLYSCRMPRGFIPDLGVDTVESRVFSRRELLSSRASMSSLTWLTIKHMDNIRYLSSVAEIPEKFENYGSLIGKPYLNGVSCKLAI